MVKTAARSIRPCRKIAANYARPTFVLRTPRHTLFNQVVRRHASTDSSSTGAGSRIYNFFYGTTLVLGLGIIYFYVTDTRASVHRWVVIPILRTIYSDPEKAHEIGNRSLKQLWAFGLHPRERGDPDQQGDLEVEVFGQILRNPIATSAGIDKHAEIPDPLFAIGPSIIEIGGTTPLPQPGNDRPRVFRLTSQNALINRYGLNSEGADHVAQQLRHRVRQFADVCGFGHDAQGETLVLDGYAGVPPGSLLPGRLLAINIAKNKSTPENDIDAVTKDYVDCAGRLAPYADILVVNVSSPNTPGLRSLQNQESLTKILSSVVKTARSVQRTTKPAVMVKVSPDEDSDEQISGICQAIWASDVDGIIVGNTTNKRPDSLPHLRQLTDQEKQHLLETGGFSGPHLFEKTVAMVKKYKKVLGDQPPIESSPSQSTGRTGSAAGQLDTDQAQINLQAERHGDAVTESIVTGSIPRPPPAETAPSKKPLINIPTDKFYGQSQAEQDKLRSSPDGPGYGQSSALAGQSTIPDQQLKYDPDLARRDQPKVIFATGGITNGGQALEVLNAGASVAMVYTALVYGGVGTISRIKDEMRQDLIARRKEKNAKQAS